MTNFSKKHKPQFVSYSFEVEATLKKHQALVGEIQARENLYASEKKAMLKEADRMYQDILKKAPSLKNDIFSKTDHPMAVSNPTLTKVNDDILERKQATLLEPSLKAQLESRDSYDVRNATLTSSKTQLENHMDTLDKIKESTETVVKTATLVDTKATELAKTQTEVKTATLTETKPSPKTQTKLTKSDYENTFKSVLESDSMRPSVELEEDTQPAYVAKVDVSQEAFVSILSERLMNQVGIDAGYATEDTARTYVATHMDEAIANITNNVDHEVKALNAQAEQDKLTQVKPKVASHKGNKKTAKAPNPKSRSKPKTIRVDNSNAAFLTSTNQSHVDNRKSDPHGGADVRNKMVWGPQQLNEVDGQRSIQNTNHIEDKIAEGLARQDQLFANVDRVRYGGKLLREDNKKLNLMKPSTY